MTHSRLVFTPFSSLLNVIIVVNYSDIRLEIAVSPRRRKVGSIGGLRESHLLILWAQKTLTFDSQLRRALNFRPSFLLPAPSFDRGPDGALQERRNRFPSPRHDRERKAFRRTVSL